MAENTTTPLRQHKSKKPREEKEDSLKHKQDDTGGLHLHQTLSTTHASLTDIYEYAHRTDCRKEKEKEGAEWCHSRENCTFVRRPVRSATFVYRVCRTGLDVLCCGEQKRLNPVNRKRKSTSANGRQTSILLVNLVQKRRTRKASTTGRLLWLRMLPLLPLKSHPKRVPQRKKDKKKRKGSSDHATEESSTLKRAKTSADAPKKSEIDAFLSKHTVTIHGTVTPVLSFDQLDVPPELKVSFAEFKEPTPIQACSWPPALEGRDVVGIAETGR